MAGTSNITVGTTILSAIDSTVDKETEVEYQENPETDLFKSNTFSYAIVVVGETPFAETYGYTPTCSSLIHDCL